MIMKKTRFSLKTFVASAVLSFAIMLCGCDLEKAAMLGVRLDPCDMLARNDVLILADMSLFASGCEGIEMEHLEEVGAQVEEEEEAGGGHVH